VSENKNVNYQNKLFAVNLLFMILNKTFVCYIKKFRREEGVHECG